METGVGKDTGSVTKTDVTASVCKVCRKEAPCFDGLVCDGCLMAPCLTCRPRLKKITKPEVLSNDALCESYFFCRPHVVRHTAAKVKKTIKQVEGQTKLKM
jgi:hypothetical protein